MTKTIKFVTTNPNIFGVYEEPKPSSSMLPEWYKKQGKYSNGVKKIQSDTGTYNHTVKACMPVFDVISAGYTFTLSADVNIYKDDFEWSLLESFSNNEKTTNFLEFSPCLIRQVRIVIHETMIANDDKILHQLIVTKKVGQGRLEGFPIIKNPTFDIL
jgi:hypothetical protein